MTLTGQSLTIIDDDMDALGVCYLTGKVESEDPPSFTYRAVCNMPQAMAKDNEALIQISPGLVVKCPVEGGLKPNEIMVPLYSPEPECERVVPKGDRIMEGRPDGGG